MASTKDFVEYVCDQIDTNLITRYKKMFGEYMIYVNEKPLLLVCDNTVYVKELECVKILEQDLEKGFPYKGAKEHFILDADNKDLLNSIIYEMEKVIPVPVRKKPKKEPG